MRFRSTAFLYMETFKLGYHHNMKYVFKMACFWYVCKKIIRSGCSQDSTPSLNIQNVYLSVGISPKLYGVHNNCQKLIYLYGSHSNTAKVYTYDLNYYSLLYMYKYWEFFYIF